MTRLRGPRDRLARPVLVLSRDPALIAATRAAAGRARRSPVLVMGSGREVLARLVAPGQRAGHLVCDPEAAGTAWPDLLRTFAEPSTRTALVLIGQPDAILPPGVAAVRSALGELHAALRLHQPRRPLAGKLPRDAAAALVRAMARDELQVSYQPVARLADRRPILLETLARWPHRRRLIDPAAFIPMAEAAGLAGALAASIAGRVARDAALGWARLPLGVSLNLPLEVVLRPSLPRELARAFADRGLRPTRLTIELTETALHYDRAGLRRALLRLRGAGYRVLLDDVLLDDPRGGLLTLPFAGLKLDRSVTERLPTSAAVRVGVRRLTTAAQARGQLVVAEGVADARLWAMARGIGIDAAQGWFVGRPVPPAALDVWYDAWRRGRRG